MKTKILVIGASGLVGSRFVELYKNSGQLLTPNEKKLDITDSSSIERFIRGNFDIDVIVNFAAFTDVAGAEKERGKEKGLAWKLNVESAENIAKIAKKYNIFLIHISTDFVFLGTKDNPGPYKEDARLPRFSKKISWYGWTKLEGERVVRKNQPYSAIVRIAYPFRASPYPEKIDSARKILELFDNDSLYPLFTDQIITPLLIDDIVKPLEKLIQLKQAGTYHIGTNDTVSYYGFGEYLLRKARGVKNAPEKGTLAAFLETPGRNPRSMLGGLDSKQTQKVLGLKFRNWKEAVDEFVNQLQKKKSK
jgi:dTDP-4-dehydrorhamnose reductase